METIKVKSLKVKVKKDDYTIYEIETDKGVKLDTLDDLKEGEEVKGEITPNENPKYNARFKKEKPAGKFPAKNWGLEKRRIALECAVAFGTGKNVKSKDVIAVAGEFFKFLN